MNILIPTSSLPIVEEKKGDSEHKLTSQNTMKSGQSKGKSTRRSRMRKMESVFVKASPKNMLLCDDENMESPPRIKIPDEEGDGEISIGGTRSINMSDISNSPEFEMVQKCVSNQNKASSGTDNAAFSQEALQFKIEEFESMSMPNLGGEQISELKLYLAEILNEKIDEELKLSMKLSSVMKIVDLASQILIKLAEIFIQNQMSLRLYFIDCIYTAVIPGPKSGELSEREEQVIEVMKPKKFLNTIVEHFYISTEGYQIDLNLQQCILTIFQNPLYNGFIEFDEIRVAFEKLGIYEVLPKAQNFDFQQLDKKSIRILNRINLHLMKIGLDAQILLQSAIDKKYLKTKDGGFKEMDCINSYSFFEMLQYIGVRKSSDIYKPLEQALCLSTTSENYRHLLPLSKLLVVLTTIKNHPYFESFGFKKRIVDIYNYDSSSSEDSSNVGEEQESGQTEEGASYSKDESQASSQIPIYVLGS